jgi:NADH:ubiquinone oxidoreductase subunit H
LRSTAQLIAYEISLGLIFLNIMILTCGNVDIISIIEFQSDTWLIFPMAGGSLMFFICNLAETNRHPFDLPEAEAELVGGYNTEYSAFPFAFFFLAEYGHMLLVSFLFSLFFLGG